MGILAAIGYMLKEFLLFVSYVKNNAFPQPLPPEEERKYLELMEQGDEHARNMLIEHNLRLVAHIVKKFENTGEDAEDLISIGTIGLIKAIESYSQGKANEGTAEKSGDKKVIGVSLSNFSDEFRTYMIDAMKKEQENYPDFEFMYSDAQNDSAKQMNQIKNFINFIRISIVACF